MADDLNRKFQAQLDEMKQEIRRLQRTNPLEAASVTSGRVRFIGGQLRVDSGGSVVIVGTLAIDGTTTVTGTFTVSGPWNLTGAGTISGNVTITGNVTSTGTLTQNGPWNMNGAGTIAGNVTQTGNTTMTGNFTVTGGGKITVGSMTIDPNISGGAIAFANGAQVFTDGSTIQVYKGNGVVQISDTEAKLQVGGTGVRVTSGHVYTTGVATKAVGTVAGGFVSAMVYDAGEMKRLI